MDIRTYGQHWPTHFWLQVACGEFRLRLRECAECRLRSGELCDMWRADQIIKALAMAAIACQQLIGMAGLRTFPDFVSSSMFLSIFGSTTLDLLKKEVWHKNEAAWQLGKRWLKAKATLASCALRIIRKLRLMWECQLSSCEIRQRLDVDSTPCMFVVIFWMRRVPLLCQFTIVHWYKQLDEAFDDWRLGHVHFDAITVLPLIPAVWLQVVATCRRIAIPFWDKYLYNKYSTCGRGC